MTGIRRKEEILRHATELSNDHEKRLERRNLLNALRNEVDEWLALLDDRKRGPTPEELTAILEALDKDVLNELRRRAS